MIKLALADDHVLLRKGLAELLKLLGNEIVLQADNGQFLLDNLDKQNLPDLVLMDINMPVMDGFQTCESLKKKYPKIKVIALSMYDNENAIIRMLKSGAKGYILKDTDPAELNLAIQSVMEKGFYYSDLVNGKLFHSSLPGETEERPFVELNLREIDFLKLVATELTYREIAEKMSVSPRTVDGYRDALFNKVNVKTRVGLVIYGLKNNIINLI